MFKASQTKFIQFCSRKFLFFPRCSLVLSLIGGGFDAASAQTYQTWRSEATSGSWQGSTNWWKGSAGPIEFGQQEWDNNHYTSQTNDNGGSTFNTWRFLFKSGANSAHTFTGDAVRFNDYGGNDPSIINQSSATHSINLNIQGDGDAGDPLKIQIDNNGGGGLTFGGTVNNQGSDIHVIGTASSAATVRFNGVISGSAGFYKENANIILLMDAANTYTGQLTIQSGTVRLNGSGDTFGASTQDIRLHSGGILDLNGISTTVGSVAEFGSANSGVITLGAGTLTIAGVDKGTFYQSSISGTGGLTMAGSGSTIMSLFGTQSYTGSTTVSSGSLTTASAMSSAAYVISGGNFSTQAANQIADTASLTVNSGTMTIAGADTVGSISGSGGTININGAYALTTNSSSSTTYSGVIAGTGGQFVKEGSGKLTLNGSNTYTGTSSISGGALRAAHANALGTTAAGTTVASGAALELSGGISIGSEALTMSGTGISLGGALRNISENNTYAGLITLGAAARINSDSGNLTINNAGTITGSGFGLTIGGSGNTSITSIIGIGAGTVTKDGTGTLTLSGANTFSGALAVQAGTLSIASIHNASTNGVLGNSATAVTLGSSGNTGTLSYTGATAASTKTFSMATSGTGAFEISNAASALTLSGSITGSGALQKKGAGTLILTANNTNSGGFVLDAGAVEIGNAGNGATAGGGSLGTGNLTLNGGRLSANSATARTITNNVTIGGAVSLGDDTKNGSLTFSTGTFAGGSSASVTKNGTGTVTISATNTYNGTFLVNSGTLKFDSAFNGNIYSRDIVNNGTLHPVGPNQVYQTFSGNISGSGGMLLNGNQNYVVLSGGNNTYSGGFNMTAGRLAINSASALGTGTFTIAGGNIENTSGGVITNSQNNAIALNGNLGFLSSSNVNLGSGTVTMGANVVMTMTGVSHQSTLSFGGAIGDGGSNYSITKNGTFYLELGGANTFGGGVVLNAGRVLINNASALGTGAFTIAGGMIDNTSGAAITNSQNNAMNWNADFTFVGTNDLNLGTGAVTLSATRSVTVSNGNLTVGGAIGGVGFGLTKLGTGTLVLSGNSTYSGATLINAGTLQIGAGGTSGALSSSGTITNNATVVFNRSNDISQGTDFASAIAGTGGVVTKNGAGMLTLSGSNSYTGATNINSGILRATHANAFGTTAGGVVVADGAALELSGGITIGAEALTLNGGGISSGGALRNITGDNTYGGLLTLGLASRINSDAGTLTLSNTGTITGAGFDLTVGGAGNTTIASVIGTTTGNLLKEGGGDLTLSANNTYTGTTTISAGTLRIGSGGTGGNLLGSVVNNANIVFNRNNAHTFSQNMSGSGNLTQAGSGNLTLSGSNSYTGMTTVSSGTLRLGGASDNPTIVGDIAISGGTLNYNGTGNNQLGAGVDITISNAGVFDIGARNESINSITLSNGTLIRGGGNLTLADNSEFSGGTANFNAVAARITVNGQTTLGNVTFTTGSSISANNGLVLGGNVTMAAGTANFSVTANSGRVYLGGAEASRGFDIADGAILNMGWNLYDGNLVKTGAGTFNLSANANNAGSITVNGGNFTISAANAIADTAAVSVGSGATMTFGGAETVGSIAGAGNFVIGANTLTVGGDNTNTTVSGVISGGGGSLIKNGSGTLTLGGANNYSGTTTWNSGGLNLNHADALGTSTLTIAAAGLVLDNTSGSAVTLANNTQNWNGNFTFTGTNDLNMGAGGVALGATRTVTVSGGTLTVGGIVSNAAGTRGITKDGAGTLVLTGVNTYNGPTILNDGTLRSGNNPSFGTGAITLNAGTLASDGATARTFANNLTIGGNIAIGDGTGTGAISFGGTVGLGGGNRTITTAVDTTFNGVVSNGGIIKTGSGNLTLVATNTFNGTLSVDQGRLSIASINNASANGVLGNSANSVSLGSSGNTGTLSYTGSTASSTKAFTMGTGGTGAFEISNATSNLTISGAIDGSGGLQKTGAGSLILTGANSYSGNTTISSGTLQIGAGSDEGAIGSGPAITNNGALVFNVGAGNRTLSANIGGTGSLTKNGSGALTLSGSNSYTGSTTVNNGSLLVTGSATSSAFSIASGATLGGNGSVGTLVINSGATLSPGNSPGTITVGDTTWEGGGNYNWQIHNATSAAGSGWDLVSSTGTLTINSTSGNTFNINLWSLSAINPDANGNPINFNASSNYSWDIASFSSISGFSEDKFNIVTSANNGTGGFTGFTGTFSISANGTALTLNYAAPSGTAIWTAGTGNWSSGANWDSGFAPSNGVPIQLAGAGGTSTNNSQLTSVNGLTFTANATGSYTVNGTALEIGATGIANDSSYAQTVATDLTMTTAQTFAATSANLTVSGAVDTGGFNLTFSGNNSGSLSGVVSGNGALVKNDTGVLTISSNNSYSGGTTINAGTIEIRNANALGTSGTISFGGGTLQWGDVTTDLSSRFSTDGGQDFKIDTGANTVSFGTALNNAGGTLTKEGSGTLNLTGASTLSSVVINSGTLRGGNSANTFGGSSALLTLNGGELRFASNFNNYGNDITVQSDSSIHNIAAGGGVVGLITFGNLTLSNSTLTVTSNNPGLTGNVFFSGTTTLADSATINVGTSANNTVTLTAVTESGGARSLTKTGDGVLSINGTAAYTGSTTISAGTLQIGTGGATGSLASPTIENNGGLLVSRTGEITLSAGMNGTGSLTKNASGTLILTGSNSYSGGTTVNAGTLKLGHDSALGTGTLATTTSVTIASTDATARTFANNYNSISGSSVVVTFGETSGGTGDLSFTSTGSLSIGTGGRTFNILNANTSLAAAITGSGSITKNGTGTLTLSGNSNYSGGTTLNTGTLVIGHAAGAGTGTITQSSGSSLLKIDTTGTIANNMDVYNLSATQTATASGSITVNNASFDVDDGDTLTLSGGVSGTGGVTKNGTGSLVLSGSNSYTGATVVNAGTLYASNANSVGNTTGVTVNGGSLLVGADDAINGQSITLNKAISGNATAAQAALAFDTAYSNTSGTAGTLTLSQDSIIDLGTGGVVVHFSSIANLNSYILHIFNWEGDTVWSGSPGGGKDQFYVDASLGGSQLDNIRFYSGTTTSSFLSSGFQIVGGDFNNEIIAVPEPETWATAVLILLGLGLQGFGRVRIFWNALSCTQNLPRSARVVNAVAILMGMGSRRHFFPVRQDNPSFARPTANPHKT